MFLIERSMTLYYYHHDFPFVIICRRTLRLVFLKKKVDGILIP